MYNKITTFAVLSALLLILSACSGDKTPEVETDVTDTEVDASTTNQEDAETIQEDTDAGAAVDAETDTEGTEEAVES